MAKITEFHQVTVDSTRVHSEVSCGWRTFTTAGKRILQLDTYGSSSRQLPGKVSQSIQLDIDGARTLLEILHQAFPALRRPTS
jgi:hypothetical protein